jgi:hypothetical protein
MLAKANIIFVGKYYAWICVDDVNIGRDGAASYRKSGKRFILFTSCPSPSLLFLYSARRIFLFYEEPYTHILTFYTFNLELGPCFHKVSMGYLNYKDTKAYVSFPNIFGIKFRGITCLTPPPPIQVVFQINKLMCTVSSLYLFYINETVMKLYEPPRPIKHCAELYLLIE